VAFEVIRDEIEFISRKPLLVECPYGIVHLILAIYRRQKSHGPTVLLLPPLLSHCIVLPRVKHHEYAAAAGGKDAKVSSTG
jgi:hypothetical protein